MGRDFHHAVLFEERVVGEHAVDAAAERAQVHVGRRLAAGPALEEVAGDAIAGFDAGDARTDFDHFAGAVGERNDVFAHRHPVAAAHDAEIAEIKRAGAHSDQNLAVGRPWRIGPLDFLERLDAGAAFGQLIGSHVVPPLARVVRAMFQNLVRSCNEGGKAAALILRAYAVRHDIDDAVIAGAPNGVPII
jgi:hypothetical protein